MCLLLQRLFYTKRSAQRDAAGLYKRTDMMDPVVKHKLLFEGCHPIIATRCREKGLPYPALDEHGEIVADDAFWDILKFTQKK